MCRTPAPAARIPECQSLPLLSAYGRGLIAGLPVRGGQCLVIGGAVAPDLAAPNLAAAT